MEKKIVKILDVSDDYSNNGIVNNLRKSKVKIDKIKHTFTRSDGQVKTRFVNGITIKQCNIVLKYYGDLYKNTQYLWYKQVIDKFKTIKKNIERLQNDK